MDEVPIGELIRLRLDASHVAVASTRLEATLRGGAGYAITHPTNRRFREAAFAHPVTVGRTTRWN